MVGGALQASGGRPDPLSVRYGTEWKNCAPACAIRAMNERYDLNSLETLWTSWKPRMPSRRLALPSIQRVDGYADAADAAIAGSSTLRFVWVAPASVMAFLSILALSSAPAGLPPALADVAGFGNVSFVAAIQTAATHSAANNLVAARFTLTNLSLSPSPKSYGLGTNLPF